MVLKTSKGGGEGEEQGEGRGGLRRGEGKVTSL